MHSVSPPACKSRFTSLISTNDGPTTVEIVNGDYRIHNEWSVRLNDAVIPSDWTNFEHDMAAALAEIARRLS